MTTKLSVFRRAITTPAQLEASARNRRMKEIIDRVQATGLHLGCWGIPKDAEHTFTRGEFVEKAVARGLLTPDEQSFLRGQWATLWSWDLSD